MFKLFREKRRRIFPFTPRINRLVHFTKLAERNRSTTHKFRMEFGDRPRVSICSGTIIRTDNRGYFHKITTQIRVSWPYQRPPLRYLFSLVIDPRVCVFIFVCIITASRIHFSSPLPFFRARFRFTRNFEIYERPLIVTLLFLLDRPVSIIAPIF